MTRNYIITNFTKPSAEAYYVYSFIFRKAHYQYTFFIRNDCKFDEKIWVITPTTRRPIVNRMLLNDLHLATETINRLNISFPRKVKVKNNEIFL